MFSPAILYLARLHVLCVPVNKPIACLAVLSHDEKAGSDLTQLRYELVPEKDFISDPDLVRPALRCDLKFSKEETTESCQTDLLSFLVHMNTVNFTCVRHLDLVDNTVSLRYTCLFE